MTSTAVISSAVARIKSLKDLDKDPKSFPDLAQVLSGDLEGIKALLPAPSASYRLTEAEADLERKVVRLSYDVVYTITDSIKPGGILGMMKKSGNSKLRELQVQLNGFREKLMNRGQNPESSAYSPRSEKAGFNFKPPNPKEVLQFMKSNFTSKSKKKKAEGETNTAAGMDEKPEPESSNEGSVIRKGDKNCLLDQIKSDLMSKRSKDDPPELYIVAECGMGKSRLAKELYKDSEIRSLFKLHAWVPVHYNFRIKGVLRLLLQQLGGWKKEKLNFMDMTEMDLISQIFRVAKGKSYLLVLDDIENLEDWESIRLALPLANSTRVIITTSSIAFPRGVHHYRISGLTKQELLTLLNNNEGDKFDPQVAEAIHDISGGSPLYATVLKESLRRNAKDEHLLEELNHYKPERAKPQVFGVCYRRLTPELKPCFLYLGLFPPRQDIQVDMLYLLLVAENLITSPKISPKDFREKMVEELAKLKLVHVEEDPIMSGTGLHGSCACKLHDLLRDFCTLQGQDEEFLETVDFTGSESEPEHVHEVGPYTRRLAVYMRMYKGEDIRFKDRDTVRKILSLLIFDSSDDNSGEEMSAGWPSEIEDLEDFTHLRVLSFDDVSFKFRKLPKGMDKLLFLTFLSFRGCILEELPSCLSRLKHLETLDLLVQHDCCMVISSNDIFSGMKRMVHLFLPKLCQRNGKKKLRLEGLLRLQTLVNFNCEIFEVGDLKQFELLEILSTISNGQSPEEMVAVVNRLNDRGEKLQHSSVVVTSFDCYNKASVSALESLMQCNFVNTVRIEGQLGKLPEGEGGGERVVEMELRVSELEHDPMNYFGKFQNLRSLVLANDAYMGTRILVSSPLFPELISLKLQNLRYLEELTIEDGAVPKLSSLQIESCGDALKLTIPEVLHDKLKNEIGGDAYSVVLVPSPSKEITTPLSH